MRARAGVVDRRVSMRSQLESSVDRPVTRDRSDVRQVQITGIVAHGQAREGMATLTGLRALHHGAVSLPGCPAAPTPDGPVGFPRIGLSRRVPSTEGERTDQWKVGAAARRYGVRP